MRRTEAPQAVGGKAPEILAIRAVGLEEGGIHEKPSTRLEHASGLLEDEARILAILEHGGQDNRVESGLADMFHQSVRISDHVDTGNVGVPIFRTVYAPDMQRIGTEDYAFCLRARDCGYRVTLADTWWDQHKSLSLYEVNRTLLHHIELARKEAEQTTAA